MSTPAAPDFRASLRIIDLPNARGCAEDLFRECFAAPFPIPRDNCGLPIPTPPEAWHQFVARYRWPDGNEETVGFCNWIRHGDVYLEGGMCVRGNFYRRIPREHFRQCQSEGGLAQMMMAEAEKSLDDCVAWFGYCGDRKALAVDIRAGYSATDHKFLIVKWFANIPEPDRKKLIDSIASIGPF